MLRLSLEQREQAIGRWHAVQQPQLVAHAFNCNEVTMQCLRERNNATNSTNNRVCSGHPRATTPRQDSYIFRQHMNNRFTRVQQASRQTISNHQRPISDDTVRLRLIANNIRCRRPAT